MSEIRVIHYDPVAEESSAARRAVRAPLLVLAHARDRDRVSRSDADLFNLELQEVTEQIQNDPELAVRFLVELLMAVDRGAELLASAPGVSNDAAVHYLLGS